MKKISTILILMFILFVATACSTTSGESSGKGNDDKVVFLTNADEEAVNAWKETLDGAGFEGKYTVQSLATSELGGKLMAEGKTMQADLIKMSTYFIQSAQEKHDMFAQLPAAEQTAKIADVKQRFIEKGAHDTIETMSELPALIHKLNHTN
ncbi:hypothetical protein [Ornithinibacillus gellani]|uniref:hypothetical protein n=1 Tax=Ornithinibacillus gellani TaxID=2293253 RepID=UPI000F469D91|nr:hypothetical protein [Ornithinibacillus gellani]